MQSNNSRIQSLDLIRGVAVLGILLMNINSFSHVGMAYLNPTLGPGLSGLNSTIWNFNWLFADMKFMSIFSILFGAGMLLFTQNIERKGESSAKWHYRRMLLLMGFGLVHAYLIWLGDILVAYSLCGMLIFLFRNKSVRTLGIIATVLFSVPVLFSLFSYFGQSQQQLQDIFSFWTPTQHEIDAETAIYLGPYSGQMMHRIGGAIVLQTLIFLIDTFWRAGAMMFLGMILYKKGILSAERSVSFYVKMSVIGITTGLAISATGLYLAYQHNWEGWYVMGIGAKFNYISSVPMALGYIGLIILIFKNEVLQGLQIKLMSVGRMAFTNYIMMSVIGLFVFCGNGLGYFGQMSRLELLGITLGIWVLMLLISPVYLDKFKQGPLERFWRHLTYLGK